MSKLERLRYVDGRLEGPQWITTAQLCELFNVSRWSIRAWQKSRGFPPGLGVSATLRFDRGLVEAWMRIQVAGVTGEKP